MLIAHVYSKHSWCSLMDRMHFFSLTSLDPSTHSSIAKITNMLFACNIVLCIHQLCPDLIMFNNLRSFTLFFALYIQIYSPRCWLDGWLAYLLACLPACLPACIKHTKRSPSIQNSNLSSNSDVSMHTNATTEPTESIFMRDGRHFSCNVLYTVRQQHWCECACVNLN